jgi:hypothetical protein
MTSLSGAATSARRASASWCSAGRPTPVRSPVWMSTSAGGKARGGLDGRRGVREEQEAGLNAVEHCGCGKRGMGGMWCGSRRAERRSPPYPAWRRPDLPTVSAEAFNVATLSVRLRSCLANQRQQRASAVLTPFPRKGRSWSVGDPNRCLKKYLVMASLDDGEVFHHVDRERPHGSCPQMLLQLSTLR